jgi:hypothetical protein
MPEPNLYVPTCVEELEIRDEPYEPFVKSKRPTLLVDVAYRWPLTLPFE